MQPGFSSWLVRYRFGSVDDLFRHLRVADGFFVPRTAPPEPSTRAIVEVSFPDGGDRLLLHGSIRVISAYGAWLDVPTARTTARWMAGPEGPRREHRRMACDLLVEVHPRGASPWLCRALDVSEGGLRLAAGSMELGVMHDEVAMTLLSPDGSAGPVDACGRLAWAGVREAGMQLLGRGSGFAELLGNVERRWAAALEIDHDTACSCAGPVRRAG